MPVDLHTKRRWAREDDSRRDQLGGREKAATGSFGALHACEPYKTAAEHRLHSGNTTDSRAGGSLTLGSPAHSNLDDALLEIASKAYDAGLRAGALMLAKHISTEGAIE